jgi:hypothetical protein
MIGRGARVRVVAVLLVAAGMLAGCGGGGSSPPTSAGTGGEMSTGPAVTSAEPIPEQLAEPIRPAVLDEPPGPAGAEAAARYFWDLYEYAMATGHVDALTALSAPDCEYCTGVLAGVQDATDRGLVLGQANIAVQDVSVLQYNATTTFAVDMTICERNQPVAAPPPPEDQTSVASRWGVQVRWSAGWQIDEVGRYSAGTSSC